MSTVGEGEGEPAGAGDRRPGAAGPPAPGSGPPAPRSRPWRSIVFAPVGDGATRRRGSDGLRVVVMVLAVTCCWLITLGVAQPQTTITTFFTSAPNGVQWVVNVVWWVGSIGTIVVLSVLALVSKRRNVARDLVLAGGGAYLFSLLLALIIGPNGAHDPTPALAGVNLGFPLARVAATIAVGTAALPYLSRTFQRLVELVILVAAVSAVVHGSGLPVAVIASLAIGWGMTAIVHLIYGSPLGLPSGAEVALLVGDLGIRADAVVPARRQIWGVARFTGRDVGGPLDVSVYGRDAHDAQLLAKVFRFVGYRDSGPTLTFTRIQQVEHEAFLTLMAARSGARVPAVLAAGRAGPSRDAVLVTRPPAGVRLADLPAPAPPGPPADPAPGVVATGPGPGAPPGPPRGGRRAARRQARRAPARRAGWPPTPRRRPGRPPRRWRRWPPGSPRRPSATPPPTTSCARSSGSARRRSPTAPSAPRPWWPAPAAPSDWWTFATPPCRGARSASSATWPPPWRRWARPSAPSGPSPRRLGCSRPTCWPPPCRSSSGAGRSIRWPPSRSGAASPCWPPCGNGGPRRRGWRCPSWPSPAGSAGSTW